MVDLINLTGRRRVLHPVRKAVEMAISLERPGFDYEISVVVADDEFVRKLNMTHRQMDTTTDVLSFAAADNPAGHLGDVVCAWGFAERQAKSRKVKPVEEAAMLAVHGALHLLGYDDATEIERAEMVSRMNVVMAASGLPTDDGWSSLPHETKSQGKHG